MSALPPHPPELASTTCPDLTDARPQARFESLTVGQLDTLLAVEQRAYTHPWTRGNFIDAMASGYETQLLMGGDHLLGYFVAMMGVDEVHLLNLTVNPDYQRQGWALLMLDALALWARGHQAEWVWLEVRLSNARAQQVYLRRGFARVGLRKRYYPAAHGEREDAVVMSLRVAAP